jgi:hypothetical protein
MRRRYVIIVAYSGMNVRRQCAFLIAFLAAVPIAPVRGAGAQSRRAILRGIDRQDPDPATAGAERSKAEGSVRDWLREWQFNELAL